MTRFYPFLFVLLWSTGFIGAKLGLPHAEPFTFLAIRMLIATALLAVLAFATAAPWPRTPAEAARIALAGLLNQAGYLGGVFYAIGTGLPAGITALIVGFQPLLTAALAGPLLGFVSPDGDGSARALRRATGPCHSSFELQTEAGNQG